MVRINYPTDHKNLDRTVFYHSTYVETIFQTKCHLTSSTLLHSFVIFPVSETISGMSGCFPVSQGQEMKDLIASSGRKATRGCQCSFSAQVWPKNSHQY